MLIDQRFDEFGDPLLARSAGVQLPAHFGKPATNFIPEIAEVFSEIDEVRAQRVETRGRRLTEVADLGSDLRDVAVGGTGEDPCRGSIMLDSPESPADIVEVILTHRKETTGGLGATVAPNPNTWG